MTLVPVSVIQTDDSSPESYFEIIDGITWACYDGMRITPVGKAAGLPDYYVHPEPGYTHGRCKMIKADGQRCKAPVSVGWTVCENHGGRLKKYQARNLKHGKYSKHLPTRLLAQYEESLQDPGMLDLSNEIALMDTKLAEELTQLEYGDVLAAMSMVRQARGLLEEEDVEIDLVRGLLDSAIEAANSSDSVWKSVLILVEERRRLVDTERKRLIDAGMYLSVAEANALLAYVVNTLVENVQDAEVLSMVSERLKVFASGNATYEEIQ